MSPFAAAAAIPPAEDDAEAAELRQRDLLALPLGARLGRARSPHTPPEDLWMLYEDVTARRAVLSEARPGVREYAEQLAEALAGNPNTPPRLLAPLATLHPDAFCRNPVAPLLVLEEPEFATWLRSEHLPGLLRRADLPAPLVIALAGQAADEPVREEARLHVAYPHDEVADWREEARVALRARAARESSGEGGTLAPTAPLLLRMVALGLAPAWLLPEPPDPARLDSLRPPAKQRPGLRRAVLAQALAERRGPLRSSPVTRCFALAHRTRTATEVRAASEEASWTARLGAALNPRLASLPDIRERLSEDGNRIVRAAAEHAPASLLMEP